VKKCFVILVIIIWPFYLKAQNNPNRYNTDSLFENLMANNYVKNILIDATIIYQKTKINPENISLKAFKLGYLEKSFIDSGLLELTIPKGYKTIPYNKKNLLTVVDYTKAGNKKRFVTVDLNTKVIIQNTLVAHGSATGKWKDSLYKFYKRKVINGKENVPSFFGNIDSSKRSSLGMILTTYEAYPANPCHLCKYFLDSLHKCGVILEGLEAGVNDKIRKRNIVMHTTGSRDYSDSNSINKIKKIIKIKKFNSKYGIKENCFCFKNINDSTSCYATECAIKKANGFIGQSQGCLVLPEENHNQIMAIVSKGSLIFIFSDIISPTSTNYFEESPIIKQIIAFANKRQVE
jgi:hypothetical protein